jgi:hypothetical protein
MLMVKQRHSLQNDLRFLIQFGWKLVGPNTVQYEDYITNDIEKAVRITKTKLKIKKLMEKYDKTPKN